MKITGKQYQSVEIEITNNDLASAIMQVIFTKIGRTIDDVGCDWYTWQGSVYIADSQWFVSGDAFVAQLVDAMNILKYGHPLYRYQD
jgi:hypothetical protein